MTFPTYLNFITCEFGRKGDWAAGYHTGIDYRAPVGTPIHTTRKGLIHHVGWDNAYGNYVVIQSWFRTKFIRHYYCHLSDFNVKRGQKVTAGQVIAFSGNTGNSSGPHLHYEERVTPYGYWNHQRPVLPEWKPSNKKWRKKVLAKIASRKKK